MTKFYGLGLAFILGSLVCLAIALKLHEPPRVLAPFPVQPQASPTAPPVVSAQSGAKTRVVITRRIPPPRGLPAVLMGAALPADTQDTAASDPVSPDGYEQIVIETEAEATGTAPVITPPPPVLVTVAAPSPPPATLLPIGAIVGTFPGTVALDYQFVSGSPGQLLPVRQLEDLTIGASLDLNQKCAGVSVNVSLTSLNPHLYLAVGAAQTYQLLPDPQAFVGVGWRL